MNFSVKFITKYETQTLARLLFHYAVDLVVEGECVIYRDKEKFVVKCEGEKVVLHYGKDKIEFTVKGGGVVGIVLKTT